MPQGALWFTSAISFINVFFPKCEDRLDIFRLIFFFFFADLVWVFSAITKPAARGRRIKQLLRSDSVLIKLLFVFKDLQRNVSRIQKPSVISQVCVVVAHCAWIDAKIKLHPRALYALYFAYGGRIAACIVSMRWLAEKAWRHYAAAEGFKQTDQRWANWTEESTRAVQNKLGKQKWCDFIWGAVFQPLLIGRRAQSLAWKGESTQVLKIKGSPVDFVSLVYKRFPLRTDLTWITIMSLHTRLFSKSSSGKENSPFINKQEFNFSHMITGECEPWSVVSDVNFLLDLSPVTELSMSILWLVFSGYRGFTSTTCHHLYWKNSVGPFKYRLWNGSW